MHELIYLRAETGALRTAGGHLVVPVVALIGDTILHAINSDAPEFVPASVLSSNVADWALKPVVNGHPTDAHGRQMSASTPGVAAARAFGVIHNPRVSGNRLRWIAISIRRRRNRWAPARSWHACAPVRRRKSRSVASSSPTTRRARMRGGPTSGAGRLSFLITSPQCRGARAPAPTDAESACFSAQRSTEASLSPSIPTNRT